jgi:hypothetical protein
MPAAYRLELGEVERVTLEEMSKHHQKAYMRECAATLLKVPTSSWRNSIEKVWRFLKQELLHMHGWADDWLRLKAEVVAFLDRFSAPNTTLLRYVDLPT